MSYISVLKLVAVQYVRCPLSSKHWCAQRAPTAPGLAGSNEPALRETVRVRLCATASRPLRLARSNEPALRETAS